MVSYDPERVGAFLGSFRQAIMELILWLAMLYAVICAVAYFGNRAFMYFPDPARVAPAEAGLDGIEEIEIAAADGTTLITWHAPAKEDKPTVLYFHGNGANAANRAPRIATMRQDGLASFTSTTVAMAVLAGGRQRRTTSLTRSLLTTTWLSVAFHRSKSSFTASRWARDPRTGAFGCRCNSGHRLSGFGADVPRPRQRDGPHTRARSSRSTVRQTHSAKARLVP